MAAGLVLDGADLHLALLFGCLQLGVELFCGTLFSRALLGGAAFADERNFFCVGRGGRFLFADGEGSLLGGLSLALLDQLAGEGLTVGGSKALNDLGGGCDGSLVDFDLEGHGCLVLHF